MRDRRPLVWFPCVWVTENVCRFMAGFGRVLADGVTARVVFMQDCFHADCLHARLFSCRLSSCKIVSMQDCFHAGFHATCRGISVHFREIGSKIHPGGSKIDPGGSEIDPGGSPNPPRIVPGDKVFLNSLHVPKNLRNLHAF